MQSRTVAPGLALFPLRLFLGGTFVYAGIQKLTDPGFLHPGAPTYIGTQLQGFANGTPGGFILRTFALPHPIVAGVSVAVLEIAIGLFALLGLKTRVAAAGGLALNLFLFATASWHTTPYFLGSDLVFAFAWLTLVLAGAAGQPALDNALECPSPKLSRRVRLQPAEGEYWADDPDTDATLTRRAVVMEAGGAALAIAGVAALAKGAYTGPTRSQATAHAPVASTSSAGTTTPASQSGGGSAQGSGASGGGSSLPAGATKIGRSDRLGNGQAALYKDPSSGQPDILIRSQSGDLTAFSAVCTHAGCTVGYQGGQIVCPCHGGVYSAQTGAVEGGPPPQPLAKQNVTERGGEIYALPS